MLIFRNNVPYTFELNYTPKSLPQFFNNKYYVPVEGKVLEVKFETLSNSVDITEINYDTNYIIASATKLCFMTDNSLINYAEGTSTELPGLVSTNPLVLTSQKMGSVDTLSVQGEDEYIIVKTSDYKLYSFQDNDFELIYDYANIINSNSSNSTKLSLTYDDQGPYVVFAKGNKVYGNYLDGTFPIGFPRIFHDFEFSPDKDILVFDNSHLNEEDSNRRGKTIYLPYSDNDYLAWDLNQDKIDPLLNIVGSSNQIVFSHSPSQDADSLGYFFQINSFDNSVILQWIESKELENPILWETNNHNANRNLLYQYRDNQNETNQEKLSAYVFPNPVAGNQATVRIFNLSHQAKFKVFDISGKLVEQIDIDANDLSHVDTIMDFSKISSGIYIGVVETNSTYKFKFAVTK